VAGSGGAAVAGINALPELVADIDVLHALMARPFWTI